jgi:hypothetical protein
MNDPLERFLAAARSFGLNPRKVGGEYVMNCPAHADQHPSLNVRVKGGKLVLICRSAHCSYPAIMSTIGLTAADGFETSATFNKGPRIIAIYDYQDESGQTLHQKVRYRTDNNPKMFIQRRPGGDGEWVYGLEARWYEPWEWGELSGWWSVRKKTGSGRRDFEYCEDRTVRPNAKARWFGAIERRVPYRLSELLKLAPGALVLWVEGEKAAEAALALGFNASTGGGTSGWDDSWSQYFRGLNVVILPDNDRPGLSYVNEKVAPAIARFAARVRILRIPGLPPGGDLYDWVEQG